MGQLGASEFVAVGGDRVQLGQRARQLLQIVAIWVRHDIEIVVLPHL
jgi:hypothetical protein